MIFYGFASGKFRVARIEHETLEEQILDFRQVQEFFKISILQKWIF
jgi:hypothetical protein